MATATPCAPALRDLERAWLRRLAARLEPVLWIELGAIALLAVCFLYWKAHLAFASTAHDRGVPAAALQLAGLLALLLAAAAAQVGARHAVRLRSPGAAPPFLALPIPDAALGAHLAAMSRVQARWLVVPASAFLVGAAGVVPWWWLPPLAIAFLAGLELVSRAACGLALRVAVLAAPARTLPPVTRVLVHAARAAAARRLPEPRWTRRPAWAALWLNDARLALRTGGSRRRALAALAAMAFSFAAWRFPLPANAALLAAFALALFAAAVAAEWIVAAIGADPADVVRALPIGIREAWGARLLWGVVLAVVLVTGHALAARNAAPAALRFFLVWIGLASLAIATLGANYGISLYPRTEQAQRVLAFTLGLTIATSLMIPLMGWIVMLTAVIHSTRRVARWSRAEVR